MRKTRGRDDDGGIKGKGVVGRGEGRDIIENLARCVGSLVKVQWLNLRDF